jgi:hypothetical protein
MKDDLTDKVINGIAADGHANYITEQARAMGTAPTRGGLNDQLNHSIAQATQAREAQEAEEEGATLDVLTAPQVNAMLAVGRFLRESEIPDAEAQQVKDAVYLALRKGHVQAKEAVAFARVKIEAMERADAQRILEER